MNLIDRAKNIITAPKNEWPVIAEETPDVGSITTGYVLPLALISAAAAFIGYWLFGMAFFKGLSAGIAFGLQNLILTIVGVFVTALVVDLLAPSFGSEKDFGRSFQLVAYAYTPSWLGGILAIFPPIAVLGTLFGLYSIYLLYLGFPVVKKTPQDKVVVYMIVTAVVLILVYFVIGAILTSIIVGIFGLSMFGVM